MQNLECKLCNGESQPLKDYSIKVIKKFVAVVTVQAVSADDAKDAAKDMYYDGEIELEPEDLGEEEFEMAGNPEGIADSTD